MALINYLNQQITIRTIQSYDEYGSPTFGAPRIERARFEDERDIVQENNGTEVASDGRFWVLPSVAVDYGDQVNYGGVLYRVIKVYHGFKRIDNHHKKLYVQRWKL
jgi:hypothetical protein